MKAKKNISNVELVRQYDLKNGLTTARQAGADLDLTPQQVYQIRWNIRNKFKKPTPKLETVQVPKEWEEDAEQMAQSVKEDSSWNLKNTQLHIELAKAKIIIKYLEERVEELSVRR